MSNNQIKPLAVGLLTLVYAATAHADAPDAFTKLDADQNGTLGRAELNVSCSREIFAALDQNGDDVIERQEFQTRGDIAFYEDKGGIDDKNVHRRWLEFRVGRFDLNDGTFTTCTAEEGIYPLDVAASQADIERAKQAIQNQVADNAARNVER